MVLGLYKWFWVVRAKKTKGEGCRKSVQGAFKARNLTVGSSLPLTTIHISIAWVP